MDNNRTDTTMRELDVDTCMRLLSEQHFGRIAIDDGDGPLILPVNYVYHEGSVLFRSDVGSKTAAAEEHAKASFEIDHVDEDARVGWSVVVRGRLVEVVRRPELDRVQAAGVTPFVEGQGKHHFVRLYPRSITGRLTPLPEALPPGWFRAAVLGTFAFEAVDEEE